MPTAIHQQRSEEGITRPNNCEHAYPDAAPVVDIKLLHALGEGKEHRSPSVSSIYLMDNRQHTLLMVCGRIHAMGVKT